MKIAMKPTIMSYLTQNHQLPVVKALKGINCQPGPDSANNDEIIIKLDKRTTNKKAYS
jgi:hypothetical protein